jgi:carboxymethylenebutenolidase
MKTSLVVSVLLCAAVSLATAQPSVSDRLEKSPRHQEWVKIKHGDRTVEAFVVFPERKDRTLAVVVIHENRGLNDWARSVADQLAEHGYVAIAPDLLSGTGPDGGGTANYPDTSAATKGIYGLDGAQVIADLDAVADYARQLPAANGKIAVTGFCWGGGQTWKFAVARPDLVVACPFYGTTPEDPAAYAKIKCPVYGFYAGNDQRVNGTLDRAKAAMQAATKTFEPVIYDGAGHGFMRAGEEENATPANKAAMEQGWKRLLEVLAQAGG